MRRNRRRNESLPSKNCHSERSAAESKDLRLFVNSIGCPWSRFWDQGDHNSQSARLFIAQELRAPSLRLFSVAKVGQQGAPSIALRLGPERAKTVGENLSFCVEMPSVGARWSIAEPGALHPETANFKSTRPSESGNPPQHSTGRGKPGSALWRSKRRNGNGRAKARRSKSKKGRA